ncbi:nuclear transport factor 2 family protein [Fulvivirga sedimenti]|uniref:Nuclear transport factor 2 family protein n=1 Tax=Fulvivirga sedimenti TaxID=2879465 RepID=A0A9X1HW98_9BACT|nr:nuclear transport factor 2 family protein [Fulvivirga sedimenti]MCA6079095.1 nuclear transport factor 2 family protein [Fulvivirga sedimenti]
MKVSLLLAVLGLLSACNRQSLYNNQLNATMVEIILSDFGLTDVPEDINRFTRVESLTVRPDGQKGWIIYPPMSARLNSDVPKKVLTGSICDLTQLKVLSISGLEYTQLPECFSNLRNLETLNLTMNRLDINSEMEKLRKLPSLRELSITGNYFDKEIMEAWRKENPDLDIIYDRSSASSKSEVQTTQTIHQFLYDYYNVMSSRDWEVYREFFWKDATLTTIWQSPKDSLPEVLVNTIDAFIRQTPQGPDSEPIFEEKPTYITTEIQGNLATAWVNYEARFGSEENLNEWTGTDLFTLMKHQGEWRIVSLAFSSE